MYSSGMVEKLLVGNLKMVKAHQTKDAILYTCDESICRIDVLDETTGTLKSRVYYNVNINGCNTVCLSGPRNKAYATVCRDLVDLDDFVRNMTQSRDIRPFSVNRVIDISNVLSVRSNTIYGFEDSWLTISSYLITKMVHIVIHLLVGAKIKLDNKSQTAIVTCKKILLNLLVATINMFVGFDIIAMYSRREEDREARLNNGRRRTGL